MLAKLKVRLNVSLFCSQVRFLFWKKNVVLKKNLVDNKAIQLFFPQSNRRQRINNNGKMVT